MRTKPPTNTHTIAHTGAKKEVEDRDDLSRTRQKHVSCDEEDIELLFSSHVIQNNEIEMGHKQANEKNVAKVRLISMRCRSAAIY